MKSNVKSQKKTRTLRRKIMGPQILLLFVQLGILLFCILGLGLLRNARENAFITLSSVVESRTAQIEKYIGNISINASNTASVIENEMNQTLVQTRKDSVSDLLENNRLQEGFLEDSMSYLLNALQSSNTSGAFIILNTGSSDHSNTKAALYLRDTQPEITYKNFSDILLLRGPYSIARHYSIPLDSEWSYNQIFSADIDNSFFTNPIVAVLNSKLDNTSQYGYWSDVFSLSRTSGNMITYTLPLIDQQGVPYGIFGFEVNEDLLKTQLPSSELPYSSAIYVLYKNTNAPDSLPENSIFSGSYASRLTNEYPIHIAPFDDALQNVIRVSGTHTTMLGINTSLSIYSPNSYFANEQWTLAGLVQQNELFILWYFTIEVLAIAFTVSLGIGLAGIFSSGAIFSNPIVALAKKVRAANPKEPIQLGKTGISEIDDLTNALEKMSGDVADAASRLSKTIDLVGLPLGGYEVDIPQGVVTLTDSMFDLLHLPKGSPAQKTLPHATWQVLLTDILSDKEEGFEDVFRYNPTPQNVRWLRIKKINLSEKIELGIILDVSEEVLHKRQNEFERDYDRLTGFLKKNAFMSKCKEIIESAPHSDGMMLVADFYFLKKIKPQLESGFDEDSLRKSVELFSVFRKYGGVISRISNAEFAVYIHNYSSDPTIQNLIETQFSQYFTLRSLDGTTKQFPLSVGTCLYPQDAKNAEDLLAFADFAQNEVSRLPQKGLLAFNLENYYQNEIMAQKNLAFRQILESNQLKITLLPIVHADTGNVIGYDPCLDFENNFIKKSEDAIVLARMHNRLFDLEKLALVSVLAFLRENKSAVGAKKFFFFSLTNEIVTQEEIKKVDDHYSAFYSNIVMCLTDSEHCDEQIFVLKANELKKRGIEIAIDKYGTALADNLLFWDINPDYLRIDPSIINEVDIDPNRHQLLQALLSYTTSRKIKTIAVGIHTKGELETVLKLGINYVQGPYLCGMLPGIIPDESRLALDIRQRVKDAYTYKFVLSDSDERFSRLIAYLPASFPLTERETVILHQICRGELNNIISADLGISANTLKTHIRNIYSKFSVKNRKELLLLSDSSHKPESELSIREKEILRLILLGKTNQEIVNTLCISSNTVRVHIWNICSKLGVKNRNELLHINL